MEIFGYERKEAVKFVIKFKGQTMTKDEWQEAYFKLISWKNTWGAYRLDINYNRDSGAFIVFVVAKAYGDNMKEWLDELGFIDVKSYDVTVGEIELEYDEGVEEYILA